MVRPEAPFVAGRARPAVMAAELGWDAGQADREVSYYRQAAAAELAAEKEPDDERASPVRAGA